jgi:hypothetical protein
MKATVSPWSAILSSLTTGLWLHSSLVVAPSVALNGDISLSAFETYSGWRSFEVITQGDLVGEYKVPGQFDGIGVSVIVVDCFMSRVLIFHLHQILFPVPSQAYLINATHIRVLLNHETPWACDTSSQSSISEIVINKPSLKSAISNTILTGNTGGVSFVERVGKAYNKYRNKNGTSTTSFGGNMFTYFCSGHVHRPNEFGLGQNRGFVDTLYIFGEEEDFSYGNGRFFALADNTMHMITGAGTGDAALLQGGTNGIGRDALENAAQVDTEETRHVALLLSPDYGEQRLRLYIGQKGFKSDGTSCGNCTGDALLLARNGLAFGSWFYLQSSLPGSGATYNGTFGTIRASGLYGSKLEDVSTNPSNPKQGMGL